MSDNDDVISTNGGPTEGNVGETKTPAETDTTAETKTPAADAAAKSPAADTAGNPFRDVALYGVLRLLLFIALTAFIMGVSFLIDLPVPLLIAAMLALIVAFPLSMFLWSDLRVRVNQGMAQWSAERKQHKQAIRQQLADREEK